MEPTQFDRLYTSKADAWGGVTLALRRPIPTRDADTVRRVVPQRVRDEILESMNSGKVIGLGTVWDGQGVNPRLDAATAVVRDFVSGFVTGNIVHAVDPGTVISLGRTFTGLEGDEDKQAALNAALDAAEEEWKKDPRSTADADDPTELHPNGAVTSKPNLAGKWMPGGDSRAGGRDDNPACDVPPSPGKHGTTDGRSFVRRNLFMPRVQAGASRTQDAQRPSVCFDTKRNQVYAEALKKGRETQDQVAPARVANAADYAQNLAAGRAAKARAS
jgi:hypothetical protein